MCSATRSVCFGFAANQAATPIQPHFLSHANIERRDGQVSVLANSPRPLDQAVAAIRQEYGWIVNYEDPPMTLMISSMILIQAGAKHTLTRRAVPAIRNRSSANHFKSATWFSIDLGALRLLSVSH
jgi:hypothetical protein